MPENIDLGLLEFLYPLRTLAFIREYLNQNTTALRRHRQSQRPLQRSRTYVSAAESTGDSLANHGEVTQSIDLGSVSDNDLATSKTTSSNAHDIKEKFHLLLEEKEQSADTRNVWQLYEQLQESSHPVDPSDIAQLLRCLQSSSKSFDIEKTRELFNATAMLDRRATHYECAITAALKQGDLHSAMAMQEEATRQKQGNFGTPILKYAVEHSQWGAAIGVWQQCKDLKPSDSEKALLWKEVKTLPLSDLLRKAIKAVEFALDSDNVTPASNFAIALVKNVLSIRNKDFDQSLQKKLLEKAQSIPQSINGLFRAAILQSISVGPQHREHSEAALDTYSRARTLPDFVPDPGLLNTVLSTYHATRNSQGMYDILEDYRKHQIEPSKRAYRLLTSQLARHGDFDTVNQLYQEAIARFGNNDLPIFAHHLLLACFRRAEVDRAISVIESLQQQHHYNPDLRAWNTVLATYARIGDCDGAMSLWESFTRNDLLPNASSYGILMGMFAKRSDYEATNALYEQAVAEDVKPNVEMIGSLVLALATNDRLDDAQKIAEEALEMDLETPQRHTKFLPDKHVFTRMWNVLLGQYALKGQLEKVFDIQKRMQELQIAFDGMTYAALMQSLCIKKLPAAAQRILKVVMPKHDIRSTALHYAIVISGFISMNDYESIPSLRERMEKEHVKPTFGTQNSFLRYAAGIDQKDFKSNASENDTFQGVRAENLLTQILDNLDPKELALLGPTKFAHTSSPNVALQSSYFPYLIALYGRKRSFDKVAEIYDKFISTFQKSNADAESDLPIEVLSALMVSYANAGAHDEVQKCWDLVLEKAQMMARKANADISQPGWVLYKYRFILNLALTRYMQSLHATSRTDELSAIIASLQRSGYQLSVNNWNKYVQILVQDKDPVLAYEICEKQLMDGWPGWERFGHPSNVKRKIYRQWVPRSWELGRPFPHYETLVHLASAYLDAKGMAYGAGKEMLQEFERVAPRAMEAVYRMPRIDDTIQTELLKRD